MEEKKQQQPRERKGGRCAGEAKRTNPRRHTRQSNKVCGGGEKSIMAAEQNGRNKTSANTATSAAGGVREFVEGWTLAQTLGEGAYGE